MMILDPQSCFEEGIGFIGPCALVIIVFALFTRWTAY